MGWSESVKAAPTRDRWAREQFPNHPEHLRQEAQSNPADQQDREETHETDLEVLVAIQDSG